MPIYDLGKVVGPQGERGIQGPPGEQGIQGPPGPTGAPGEPGVVDYGVVTYAVSTHNTATDAHNDIRLLIEGLTSRLNALANSDDTTLDQMAEVVAYIKDNRELIEQITTGKVSVADIVDNLTTNVADKPLSAAQGVALKALIDGITVPTKVSQLENDRKYLTDYTETDPNVPAWAKQPNKPSYTAEEVGALPTTGGTMAGALELSGDPTTAMQASTKKYVDAKVEELAESLGGASLPSGYTQVEYIESTGTQYIDTGVSAPAGFRFVGKVCPTGLSGDLQAVVGAFERASGTDTLRNFITFRSSSALVGAYDYGFTRDMFNSGVDYDIDFDNSTQNFSLKVNGAEEYIDINLENPVRTANALYLFALNNGAGAESFGKLKLYPHKIYAEGALARDYVPCVTTNGEGGLYDFVTKKFYSNIGSGAFLVGNIVGTLSVEQGGTGATNAEDARANLGINSENWTFTLEDGTEVTKAVYIG